MGNFMSISNYSSILDHVRESPTHSQGLSEVSAFKKHIYTSTVVL